METSENKPINKLIDSTEQKILTGNLSGIYNEIENTEKLIRQNIERILINIYNTFQVMDSKKKFVDYISGFEKEDISKENIDSLKIKSGNYRNIELPRKWNDMKVKLQYTKETLHFKAWYFAFQQGRYENVVANVKEYMVKEILKNIIEKIGFEKKISFKKEAFLKFINEGNIDGLKKEYKNLFSKLKEQDKKDELFESFDNFFLYYLYLNYDLTLEKQVFDNIFKELSDIKTGKLKIKFLNEQKKRIIKTINNEKLKKVIEDIFDAFILLFEALLENNKKGNTGIPEKYSLTDNIAEIIKNITAYNSIPEVQKYLRFQIENFKVKNDAFIYVLQLLFYLFSTENKEPRKRVIALCERVKIKTEDKQKYLKLLKDYSQDNMPLKDLLEIKNEDVAFGAVYILYHDDELQKRIRKLENFKISEDEKVKNYKEYFEITANGINEVIKFLNDRDKKADAQNENGFMETETSAEESAYLPREQKEYKPYEIEETDKSDFTANEVEDILKEKKTMTSKSSSEIISEQRIRADYKKVNELLAKRIDELSSNVNKEILEKIKGKAHEIYEDENKKKEDKVSEILAFLTTCFPEAVPKILSEEILPVFRTDNIDLDMHNTLQSINESIFKQALAGTDVSKNMDFLEKKISKNGTENIKTIVIKINKMREDEKEKIKKALQEINEKDKPLIKKDFIKKGQPPDGKGNAVVQEIKKDILKAENEKTELNDNPEKEEESPYTIEKEIEETLSGLSNFIKPHLVILNIVRQNKEYKEDDFDTERRRGIIEKLFSEGKIFTYDGSTYIGEGQINNLIKSNAIPSTDKAVFIKKLDDFIERFKTKEELFNFLGVADDMELRKLNYTLDKFGVARKITSSVIEENKKKVEPKKNGLVKGKERVKEFISKSKDTIKKIDSGINEENIKTEKPEFKEKKAEKKEEIIRKKEIDLNKVRKDEERFISSAQKEVLAIAFKEINKNIEKLIKQAETKNDMDAIARNYFGNTDLNRRNLLNLCYDMKKIAEIINKDKIIFSKLSFNREKITKVYNTKLKKIKK